MAIQCVSRLAKLGFAAMAAAASFFASASFASDIYVSGTGASGDGSAANPFRTLTEAFAQASAGDVIRVDEGTYDAAAGESFPIAVASDVSVVGWSQSGAAIDPTLRVVTGDNSVVSLFSVANGLSFAISDCVLRDTSNAAITLGGSTTLAATNVTFTQSLARSGTTDYNKPQSYAVGSVVSTSASTMEFQSCQFLGMNRDAMLMNYGGDQNTTFTLRLYDCLVANNTLKYGNIVEGRGCRVAVDCQRTVFRGNSQTNTGAQHDAYGASILWTRGNGSAKNYTNIYFDRCEFLGNSGRALFGINNAKLVRISNSIFAGNTSTGYLFGGYSAAGQFLNCTILGGTGGLAGRNNTAIVRNSILEGIAQLQFDAPNWAATADNLQIYDTIIHDCGFGIGINAQKSRYVTADPILENVSVAWDAAGFDPRPRAYSPAIDAGANANVVGGEDLYGNARVSDNDADGTATVDLGACESLFNAALAPTFCFPFPGFKSAIRGQTISLSVTIDAGASITAPVIASVTYPTGITGDSTLTFADGSATATLNFTVANDAPDGLLRISLAESGTSQGVLPAIYDVEAADLTLTTGGDYFYAPTGETIDIPVSIAVAGAVTPVAITVTPASIAGDGTSTASWTGGDTIPVDGHATAGALHIVAGLGVNTVALTLSSGTFVESGAATTTLTIVGHDGVLRVDAANGDDAIATGLAGGIPFKSVTCALSKLSEGMVSVAPGVYSPSTTGEIFPLTPGAIRIVGASPETTVLDAENGADNVILYMEEPAAGEFENLSLRGSVNVAAYIVSTDCAITNCVFTQTTSSTQNPGGIWVRDDSHVEAVGCVFTNMVRRAAAFATQTSLTAGKGDRYFNLVDCLFENNRSYYGAVATYEHSWFKWNLTNCVFRANTTQTNNDIHDSKAASAIWIELGQHGTRNTMTVDACQFLGNTGNHIIAGDHSAMQLTSCLFADNAATICTMKGYNLFPYFRNCTFIRNTKGLYAGDNSNFDNYFYNSIFYNDGPLSASGRGDRIKMDNCLVWGTVDLGGGYTEITSGSVSTDIDPILENAGVTYADAAFDPRPRPYSPAIDASTEDAILSARDLDGNARVADNNDDGVAAADLGACESTFHAAVASTFHLPLPGKAGAFRGGTIDIPVSIDPAAAAYPVTATVAYGEGLSGTNELVFADSATTNVLTVAVAADAPDFGRISFADAATPAGVDSAVFDLALGDMSLAIGGKTVIHVREGVELDIPVSIALEGTGAPAAISVLPGSSAGTGTSEISWNGPATIPAGGTSTEGALHIVAGQGVNTFSLQGDYPFEETSSTQVTLTIIAYSGCLYADSANGSDATGTGLADAPFATITHAISCLGNGDEVRILPGTYSEATGETFPLAPFGVALRGWDGAGETDADPASVVIDGTNGVNNAVSYTFGAYTGLVANIHFRETKESAVMVDVADVTVRNCVFTQSVADSALAKSGVGGGVQMADSSHVVVEGCVFDGIVRRAAVLGTSASHVRDGSTLCVVDSLFTNCVSSVGAIGTYQSAVSLFVTNCTFVGNSTQTYVNNGQNNDNRPGVVHDSMSAAAIYVFGPGAGVGTIPQVAIDRCKFLGNTGNVLVGMEYIDSDNGRFLPVSNSLFADNTPDYGMFSGYWTPLRFANCTFIRNSGGYCGRYNAAVFNSVFYHDGPVATNFTGAIYKENGVVTIHDSIVFETPDGESDRVAYAADATFDDINVDPLLRNAGVSYLDPAFDARPLIASPARNAGLAAYAVGDFDLDGNARVMFGAPDLGCYEGIDAGGTMFMFF